MRTLPGGEPGASAFGTLLRRFRLSAGLSQEALAERACVSVEAIGTLERGLRRAPYAATIELLADALELSREDRQSLASAVDRRRAARATPRPAPRVFLPSPLTRLIGRDQEIGVVRSFMEKRKTRLLTITGVGGVGKTRFALELAHRICDEFEDGAAFATLAAIRDPAHIVSSLVQSLGRTSDDNSAAFDALCAQIADRHVLLVIDNFEHVLAGGPLLAELLRRCPRAIILVTSREALRVSGEHEFSLQPLELGAAVELLTDRSRAIRPELDVDAHQAAFASICRRLDGLPLAIELAAARLRHYPVAVLLERLSARLEVLTSGARDSPPRQRTLRDAIDWSYQLLDEAEGTIFQISSLFAGGGTLEALETVSETTGLLETGIDQTIASLADKHLISVPESAGPQIRFEMLETIREYAYEQLVSSGRMELCRRRFAEYYVDLANRAAPHLRGADAPAWLDLIAREYENLRATLRWAIAHDRSLGVGLALNVLRIFWERRGYLAEALEWLEALVDPLDQALSREDPKLMWDVMNLLAISHAGAGNAVRACALFPEVLEMARGLDDPRLIARTLNNFGKALLEAGEFERARLVFEESLPLKQRVDDPWSIASTLANLGVALRACRQYDLALARQRAALELFRSIGDRWAELAVLNYMADVYRDRGEYVEAARLYRASLEANADGIKVLAADSFQGLTTVAASRRQLHRAAVLAGATDTIRRESGRSVSELERAPFDAARAAARAGLGAEAFADAWSEGAALPLAEAIEVGRAIGSDLAR